MFRAYSRRVDKRIFSEIDSWLGRRGDSTDSLKFRLFTQRARKQSPQKFFYRSDQAKLSLSRTNEYPFNYTFEFQSAVSSGNPENDLVHGDFFPNFPLGSPSVIVLSGWMEGVTDYTRLAHRARLSGRNFWAMDLPYHARRAPQATRSGELAITGDLLRTLTGIRQAVVDVRTLVAALWEMGARDITLVGFSLGAWVGSLALMVEEKVSGAVLVTPVVRPDELLQYSPFFSSLRNGLPRDYRSRLFDGINHLYLPAYGNPVVDPEHIHLLGSIDDPLASTDFLQELSSNWGCDISILPGGHITVYLTARLWQNVFSLINLNNNYLG